MQVPQDEIDRVVKSRLGRWQQHPDWEDIYQEGRIAAWRAVQAKGRPHGWKTLADRAAGRALCDFLRSARNRLRQYGQRHSPVVQHEPLPDELEVADFAAAVIDRVAFQQRLAELTAAQRAVVLLHLGQGLTLQETARRLGISRNSAKERLNGALRRCRCRMEEEQGG